MLQTQHVPLFTVADVSVMLQTQQYVCTKAPFTLNKAQQHKCTKAPFTLNKAQREKTSHCCRRSICTSTSHVKI